MAGHPPGDENSHGSRSIVTVFDNRTSGSPSLLGQQLTPGASTGQVGWIAAFVWPTVWTAVVAGALLGADGVILLWIGIAGVVAMAGYQGFKLRSRRVRRADLLLDTTPGEHDDAPHDF
jgi:hypothetical protein